MTSNTCADMAERLELYAADECDPPDREVVERHLDGCPTCAAQVEETRRLMQLLDLRLQEPERLLRLHERLEAERRPRKRAMPWMRRLAPLAALLLISLGMGLFLGGGDGGSPGNPLTVKVLSESRSLEMVPGVDMARSGPEKMSFPLEREGKTAKEFRAELTVKDAHRPSPPRVRLVLQVRNEGTKPLFLDTKDPRTELRLHVVGPAGSMVATPTGEIPAALEPRTITLAPGQKEDFRIDRLVTGTRDHPQALYWTEPGEYTLTINLRVATTGGRMMTIDSGPIRAQVQAVKPQ